MFLVFQALNADFLRERLLWIFPILACLTIHELAHGLCAFALGDDTAKRQGRLTLNPIKHIDPVGFLMMFFVRFGWAKAVPVNPQNLKRPKLDMALIALAGPLSNFLLAFIILIFQIPLFRMQFQGSGMAPEIASLIFNGAVISIFLGLFNLLPIPPLDGSKIAFSLLPDKQYNWLMQYERYGMFILIALIWTGATSGILTGMFGYVLSWLVSMTRPISMWLF